MSVSDFPDALTKASEVCDGPYALILRGGSCIIAPDGSFVVEPVFDDVRIITATLDLTAIDREKKTLGMTGHYSRPDVFDFRVRS